MGTSAIHHTLSHTHTHTVQSPTRRKWLPPLLPSLPSPHAPRCPLCAPPADPPLALLQLRFSTSTRHRRWRLLPQRRRLLQEGHWLREAEEVSSTIALHYVRTYVTTASPVRQANQCKYHRKVS